jgi:beta-N-acetylhexosaminidase
MVYTIDRKPRDLKHDICLVHFMSSRRSRDVRNNSEVRRLALGCLALGFAGPVVPAWLKAALADGLAGVILFGSNVGDGDHVAALTDELRAAADREVVVGLDEEGGDVTRLDVSRGSASPGAAALGALDEPAATEEVYASIGARLAAAGVTVDLAPVADVNVDPDNPVIGVRSFSADPAVAARHVAAAVRGLQGVGVAACAKHFPGHGATAADSHHQVATVERSRSDIDRVELTPFRAAIAAGTRAIMTAHLLVPALDPAALATVSKKITTGLLREQLGFDGVIVTDALEMKAVSATIGLVDGFVAALIAGADLIETGAGEYPRLIEQIPAAVAAALRSGRLSDDRLADAAGRSARLATRTAESGVVSPVPAAAARCVEVRGNLPLLRRPMVVECRTPNGMATGELPWSLAARLRELSPGVETMAIDAAPDLGELTRAVQDRSVVLVVRDPMRNKWQRDVLDAVTPALIVDVGWPADDVRLPVVRTRGIAPGLLDAAARLVADRIEGQP